MSGKEAQAHIGRFLKNNPLGHLYVLTGYASIFGLAWLQKRARGRSVTLVVGDDGPSFFDRGSDADRQRAAALLNRRRVTVMGWGKPSGKGESMMHAKCWVVMTSKGKPKAALVGSANLTHNGLCSNWEMMSNVSRKDLRRIGAQVRGLMSGSDGQKPRDIKRKLLGYISPGSKRAGGGRKKGAGFLLGRR